MDWYEEYKKSLKMREIEEIFDLLFYRPLAFLFVRSIYRTQITPNNISVAAIIIGIGAGFFYSAGTYAGNITGAILFLIFNILDCSDGQLARLKKNGTPAGRIIDGISDYIASLSVYSGICLGFYRYSHNFPFWLTLMILAVISGMVHGMLVDYYRTRFIDNVTGRKSTFKDEMSEFKSEYQLIKNKKGKIAERMILKIYFIYSSVQSILVPVNKETKVFTVEPQEYYQANRAIMRFWLLLGPTTQITALAVCSFLNRLDIFIWMVIALFNLLALVLWIVQQVIDVKLTKATA
jgi:phosphatidylglycerophosphate synthase